MEKILIVKASSLGDIVHCFPVISYLKKKFPNAQIDWVVEKPFAPLLYAHPAINHVFEIETKVWRRSPNSWGGMWRCRKALRHHSYDVVFDLQGNLKSGLVTSQARAKCKVGFGRKTVPEWPNCCFTNHKIDPPSGKNIREDYLYIVQSYFQDATPFVDLGVVLHVNEMPEIPSGTLVCPSSAWRNKSLPQKQLISFLKTLNRGPYQFLWGNEKEKIYAERLVEEFAGSCLLPELSLPQLQVVMARSQLIIAMDSFPLHLAATTATPTISFFGPSSANKYAPKGQRHTHYQGGCPYGVTFEKRCPKLRTCPTGACMEDGIRKS